jgi:hypothetical protein
MGEVWGSAVLPATLPMGFGGESDLVSHVGLRLGNLSNFDPFLRSPEKVVTVPSGSLWSSPLRLSAVAENLD